MRRRGPSPRAGVAAATTATLVTQPFDVVKTAVQVDQTGTLAFRSAVAAVGQTHGLRGFFRGTAARVARKAIMTASTWTLYEEARRLLVARPKTPR